MTKPFDVINTELQLIAQEQLETQVNLQYEDYLEHMNCYLEMLNCQNYQEESYDADACYYGEYV
jgi:hypothetical protein